MSDSNTYATMPGLTDDEHTLFDFYFNFDQASGSSNMHQAGMRNDTFDLHPLASASLEQNAYQATYTPDVGMNNNMAWQKAVYTEEAANVVHVTNSELQFIQALRAEKHPSIQDDPSFNSTSPQGLNPNTLILEQTEASGTLYNYDGSLHTDTNLANIEMLHSDTLTNGSGTFKQPQFQEPAGEFGPPTDDAPDCAPGSIGQSRNCVGASPLAPPLLLTKQFTDQAAKITTTTTNVSTSPIQTTEQSQQPVEVLQPWSVGRKCTWPSCLSTAVFKNKYSLNNHVKNVHTNPLFCTVANCSRKAPFSRRSDLRRHEESVHSSNRRFSCSVPSCDAHIKDFTWKDHLTTHMRDRHNNYFCPIHHCPRGIRRSFANAEDLAKHVDNEHGDYECAVKSCAQAASSKFSGESLENHLRNHHSVYRFGARYLVWQRMKNRNQSHTAIEADLNEAAFTDCKICGKTDEVITEE